MYKLCVWASVYSLATEYLFAFKKDTVDFTKKYFKIITPNAHYRRTFALTKIGFGLKCSKKLHRCAKKYRKKCSSKNMCEIASCIEMTWKKSYSFDFHFQFPIVQFCSIFFHGILCREQLSLKWIVFFFVIFNHFSAHWRSFCMKLIENAKKVIECFVRDASCIFFRYCWVNQSFKWPSRCWTLKIVNTLWQINRL